MSAYLFAAFVVAVTLKIAGVIAWPWMAVMVPGAGAALWSAISTISFKIMRRMLLDEARERSKYGF